MTDDKPALEFEGRWEDDGSREVFVGEIVDNTPPVSFLDDYDIETNKVSFLFDEELIDAMIRLQEVERDRIQDKMRQYAEQINSEMAWMTPNLFREMVGIPLWMPALWQDEGDQA